MKINFTIFDKILPVNKVIQKKYVELTKILPNDSFETQTQCLKNAGEIFACLKGTYSKEDLKLVDTLVNYYKKAIFDLTEFKQSIVELLLEKFSQCEFQAGENNGKVIFTPQKVTLDFKNFVQDSLIKLLAVKKIETEHKCYTTLTPFSSWYNTNLGVQNPTFEPSKFTHLRDKAIQLVGELTAGDLEKIKQKEQDFAGFDNTQIINRKLKILQKLSKAFSKNESDFIGVFSDRELNRFKALIINYDALNNIQKSRNIYTKSIESVLFATPIPEDLKKFDYIKGLGLVVNKILLKNNPAVIMFSSNKDGFNQFKMYDLNKLKNSKSKREEKESLISEIQFRQIKDYYLVRRFQNHYTKDYPDAGKIIGLQLMKLLAEKDCKPLRIEALAYAGSKHSPVNYYMHYGFIPVNYTKEEIEELAKQNGGNFPYETPVKLVLNDFEGVRERIKKIEKIYFS